MKKEIRPKLKIVYIIMIYAFIVSCNQKQKSKNIIVPDDIIMNSKSDSVHLNTLKTDSIKQIVSSKLLGKYFVENFRQYLENGFELKKNKPKYNYAVYTFNFTENGEIKFEDLTEVYDCGNGILVLNNGKWKINDKGNIELSVSGEYSMINKFNTESEYKLSELKNGNKKMELVKVLKK
ncbi:hypothetical protein MWU76_20655 [Gelidibacter sp. F2691]|nr:hypothetical protein [Gelidibacter sp. F2691]